MQAQAVVVLVKAPHFKEAYGDDTVAAYVQDIVELLLNLKIAAGVKFYQDGKSVEAFGILGASLRALLDPKTSQG
ncbi:MAG: hypothetical protein DSM106950_00810 [Stigonema ocellatum SAG 48.90 = DSM 106950]|nr:hypothetical protein [Stigonema ocellatum SAG 48.90 = DSM 106950]